MRDLNRIDRILSLIKQLWVKQTDTRFNQLIHNLSWEYSRINNDAYLEWAYDKFEDEKGGIHFFKDAAIVDLFHLEDDKFEEFLIDKLEGK
jgi:2-oxoglutarate dehydrogenase complex dehydrogenase (E1) component-like enzyme